MSRPGLVWSLVSFAAREAQAIGLQRDCDQNSSLSVPEKRDRKIAFWALYIFDRVLSLTFGRVFFLPDFDIDIGYPHDAECILWTSFEAWIKLAEIQGNIFQQLYSAKALKQDDASRRKISQQLDGQVRTWWAESGMTVFDGCADNAPHSQLEYAKLELEFNYHSTLIMIHRVYRVDRGRCEISKKVSLAESRAAISVIRAAISKNKSLAENSTTLWCVQIPLTGINWLTD